MFLGELGQRIRARREQRGLKQADVANALQVSPQAVSKWERGENAPDILLLGSLATLLGVSTDWLLGTQSESREVFEATVLTSSVRGAFEKSRGLAAKQFATWANGFFQQITEAVLQHGGVPVKYMGDRFLGFFSGANHRDRAMASALLARRLVGDDLRIGLSSGEIHLGSVGHPDYARPDIMGETVNIAFLTVDWADLNTASGFAATASALDGLPAEVSLGARAQVEFKEVAAPVDVLEVTC